MDTSYTIPASGRAGVIADGLWLKNRAWDLTFISFSAGLVALPFLAYECFNYVLGISGVRQFLGVAPRDALDVSRNAVNGLIALFIGGPHMYATFTRTWLDGEFRRRHIGFVAGSLVLPVLVIALGTMNFQLLITFFFFWASVHILHQIAYIIDAYNGRRSRRTSTPSRFLDYAVVFSSLYPIGVWRMVNGNFKIGQIEILFPKFLLIEDNPVLGWGLFYVVTLVFATSLSLWIGRSYREYQRGELHLPKTLLMALTIVVSFFIPSYRELDVAFQGFNVWHSFQYLGLTLYINRIRERKVGIKTPFIRALSQEGKGWKFYLFNVGCALGAVAVIALLLMNSAALGLGFDQCYYIVVLSFLLMHYYHDHLLFAQTDALRSQ